MLLSKETFGMSLDTTPKAPPDPKTLPDIVPETSPDTAPEVLLDTISRISLNTAPEISLYAAPKTSLDTAPGPLLDTAPKTLLDTAPESLLETTPQIFRASVKQPREWLSLTRIRHRIGILHATTKQPHKWLPLTHASYTEPNNPCCRKTAARMALPHTYPTYNQNSPRCRKTAAQMALPYTRILYGIKYSTLPQNTLTHASYMNQISHAAAKQPHE